MRISADQGIRKSHQVTILVPGHHHGCQVFKIDLVDNTRRRRHDPEIIKSLLPPPQELIALAIALKFNFRISPEGIRNGEEIYLHGMIDHQVNRNQRVDFLRVPTLSMYSRPHRSKVHHSWNPGEILHDHAPGKERHGWLRRQVRPPAGQVKVKVAWCGLCGTDLHEYLGGPLYIPADGPHPLTGAQAPVILGHEMSGDVVEVGAGVTRVKVGDRVALCPIIGCLKCQWCRSGLMGLCTNIAFLGISWHGGGFAQVVNVYEYMCYRLPAEVSYEVGSLVEPFAATYRALKQAAVQLGETVAIVGAGPIGLMALQSARIQGAQQVIAIEPAAKRQELARRCGATAVVDPRREDVLAVVRELTKGEGADVVIECSGIEATGILAGRIARRKGRVVVMGVFEHPAPIDYTDIVYGEKIVTGSMGGYGVFDEAIQAMANGKFDGDLLITGKIKLDGILSGLDALIKHKDDNVKILVSPL